MVLSNTLKFKTNELNKMSKPNNFGQRHVQTLLLFFGMIIAYFQRVNISAAIVPMSKPTAGAPYYDWDLSDKSLILSSFFWGYVVMQVPAGLLAKHFGPRLIMGLATLGGGVVQFFHPLVAANLGWIGVCILRILTGVLQSSVYPCVHTLLAKWVPCTERGFLSSCVYSGGQLGTTIILSTSGPIFNSSMGWPGLFYISGGFSIVWALLFLGLGAEEPADSKFISKVECEYIERLTGNDNTTNQQALPIPWKDMFTSLPFYGLIAAHCGFVFGFYMLLTEMPSYMSHVLQFNVNTNALLSALPYFAMWLLSFIVSTISDIIINRQILSITTSRKLFNSIGQLVPMGCLISLGYMTVDDKELATVLLTIAVGVNAACLCGYLVNHIDLSPNFAGLMMSITNGLAGITSIFASLLVGAVVTVETDPTQWRTVFFITAGIYLLCSALFLIFGKATVQSWNEPSPVSSTMTLSKNSEHISRTVLPTIVKARQ